MNIPLPEAMRPKKIEDFLGQSHLIGDKKIIMSLRDSAKKTGFFPSLIFWGPPGSGKTSLARLIAYDLNRPFLEFTGASASIKEIESATKTGDNPIIFIDEIHRLNKAQQDRLLPSSEKGSVTIIGATTENPSFAVIPALLSRSRVLIFKELDEDVIESILDNGLKYLGKNITDNAKNLLINLGNGDARVVLNILQIASSFAKKTINEEHIKEAIQRPHLTFDKGGEEFYNTISAFIKSMRAGQTDAVVYYLARMIESGQDPLYIARRMVIFASEDIGMAQPTALVVANEVYRACETIGYPECSINLAHGAIYLSEAKKDRRVYDAIKKAQEDTIKLGNLPIPMVVRNAVTSLMKSNGYGKGYEMYTKETFLPEKLKGTIYFKKDIKE